MEIVRHRGGTSNVLVRNALALILSTVGSAALGMAFWALAARLYPPVEVGGALSEVAAVMLLANLAQLGLVSIFTRFLPVAHKGTGRLVRMGYGATFTLALLLCAIFLGFHFDRSFLPGDPMSLLGFLAVVLLFAMFSLQDSVLTAFRRSTWVPIENLAVAVLRLAMLPIILAAGVGFGVLTSWVVPLAGAVVVVTALIFGRLVPDQQRAPGAPGPPATRSELISYAASQYVSGAVGSVVTMLPPVLVAMQLGTQQAAYFYFPWLFCSASISLLWNIVFPLVVEAVHDADRTPHLLARAVWLGGLVTLGGSLVLGVGAPWILAIVGSAYEQGGTMPLRLIALSLPFTGVNTLYIALSLILKRTWAVTRLQGIASLVFVVGSFPAMHRWGITGMALAFLASRAFLAVCAVPGIIGQFRELVANAATVVLQLGDLRLDPMYAETQVIYLPKSPPATVTDHLTGGSTVYLSSAYGGALLTATGGFAPVPARSSESGPLEMVV